MLKYKIKEACFIGGVYRLPGGKHDPYVTSEPLKKVPKAIELIVEAPEVPVVDGPGPVSKPEQPAAPVGTEQPTAPDFTKDEKGEVSGDTDTEAGVETIK